MIKSPRGTVDILPEETSIYQFIEDIGRKTLHKYGYQEIRTPIFEQTKLFIRSIGEDTDIVTKEMYTFQDKKGRSLTLRPECTASVVRAFIEHKFPGRYSFPLRLYYIGPMFRYERPQAGRQRQFWQIGGEVFGAADPGEDAETVSLIFDFLRDLGLKVGIELEVNCVGCLRCRPKFYSLLHDYFQDNQQYLCHDCTKKIERNPMRILDCKNEPCQEVILRGPGVYEVCCSTCMLHFKEVTSILDMVQIHYTINPRMVRGLDYYTKFAFEFVVAGLGAQNAVVAGGRYDNLVKDLGGPDTPAVGFAAGCERLVLALKSQREVMPFNKTSIDVYVASVEGIEKTTVFTHTQALRRAGLRAIFDWKEKSLKSQLRSADKSAVRFVVIITKDGYVLRDMNTSSQENVSWDDIPIRIKKHMG